MKAFCRSPSSWAFGRFLKAQNTHPHLAALRTNVARKFTIHHRNYARKITPRSRVYEQPKPLQSQDSYRGSLGAGLKEKVEAVGGSIEEPRKVFGSHNDALEAFENVTEEQKAFWLSDGFSSLCSEYPEITLHIRVPPEPPGASVENYIEDMAMDLAVEIHVANHPRDTLRSTVSQMKFAETMMTLVAEHMGTITEGLRTGWLAPVKEGRSWASVFDSDE